MGVIVRKVKAKNARTKRFLKNRESKTVENTKSSLFIRGGNTSTIVTNALKDMHKLKQPHSVMLSRKNPMLPFEDDTSLEFLTKKNDSSLFCFGSHSKKRPHNLIMGRMFDFHVLDMLELGIDDFKALQDFREEKPALGSKPCLTFNGDLFDSDEDFMKAKSLMMDFFRGQELQQVNLNGLDHVISFTADSDKRKLYMRVYMIKMMKSGTRVPRIELRECGPSMDLSLRRKRFAAPDLLKRASKVPRTLQPKKVKNITTDVMASKVGQIHMERQDLGKLQTRKLKAFKERTVDSEEDDE